MIVAVLNPNQELQIINFQKFLINQMFMDSDFICRAAPLWIPLSQFQDNLPDSDLKKYADRIKSITLNKILVTDSSNLDTFFKSFAQKVIAVDVTVQMEDSITNSLLPLIFLNLKKESDCNCLQKDFTENPFPMKLKVFKIGKALTLSENARALESFVWKKIH